MKTNLKQNIMMVTIANVIYMAIVAATNFLLPKYCSIETYANIKTFTLYIITYSSLLTFGYIKGVYLQYGGKEISTISPREFASAFWTFISFELPISLIVLILGCYLENYIIVVFSVGLVSTNITEYYKSIYQATGEFRLYSIALNMNRFTTFFTYIVLIFLFKTDNYIHYILIPEVLSLLIVVSFNDSVAEKDTFSRIWWLCPLEQLRMHVLAGYALMMGNFATFFFVSMDRWFVKVLMPSTSFALYAFAVSMQNLITTLMNPIAVSMYNYLCRNTGVESVVRVKRAVLIYSFFIIASAFPCKFVVEYFLINYRDANSIIFILFAAQIFFAIVKGIYVNLYKVNRKQNFYLFQTVVMVAISFLLNVFLYAIFRNMIAIAVATFLTSVCWLIWCEKKDSGVRFCLKDYLAIILVLLSFFICGVFLNSIVGVFIYVVLCVIVSAVLMRDSFRLVIISLKKLTLDKIRRLG